MPPFHPLVDEWFRRAFGTPTPPQALGWPPISRGESTLLLSPTGSGKTLAAFLWCINRLMFEPLPPPSARCRVLYISPLKALAVDVERNLRAPVAGIANLAHEHGVPFVAPAIAVRTGDTPASERARFRREPADILITTPESLYLLLTSGARNVLRSVDTVIVDEIHALVPTKRGAHLALSLERLETLVGRRLQRIGLSATQRPLDEVARFLGGAEADVNASGGAEASDTGAARTGPAASDETQPTWRPVTIVDAGTKKALELRLELPVEDMARAAEPVDIPSGSAAQGPVRPSIWTAMHPRLLELIEAHRSTLIFVNSRRIAERLASALNDLAGVPLVRAHHGSIARAQRLEIEDALKAGTLRGLVATSSLELGIDMGAIDLVIQIEAPPSVASGLQRIGRAGHQVDAASRGVIVPKYRGDLVACAAVTRAMQEGLVESSRYPRNPLDVLAQQLVAMVSMERWDVDTLFATIRRAAPFAPLSRGIFESVLDILAGRYPSDEFAELRPRVTWDRLAGTVTGRDGAQRVAIVNGGTIPDRGLYGVFLAGAEQKLARVGELDEEMVFESRAGETFLLGASTWRIEEITHDRVIVSPAPGEPGKMPFWKGEAATRPIEFGRQIGALVRRLASMPAAAATDLLVREHALDPEAAEGLLEYLAEQRGAASALPDDRTVVVERYRDELGDWRVCVLSPLGGQVLAPWSMAAVARIRDTLDLDVETMWTDEGFVVRFPDTDEPPDVSLLLPPPGEAEDLVVRQLGGSALFAAKFREAAARALLLPRRRPGQRTPLWQQRKRASDLLAVAARFPSFPILLEAYRETLRDVFDMPAFTSVLADIARRDLRVVTVDSTTPSPFAASLMFGYVANYLYDGDAPLAERRAQALTIDHAQLRELVGEAELRELLDADVIAEVERELQHLVGTGVAGSVDGADGAVPSTGSADGAARSTRGASRAAPPRPHGVRTADGLHDLLLRLGDLDLEEIAARAEGGTQVAGSLAAVLLDARRAIEVPVAGTTRLVAVEDAARYRDALGVPLPAGLPESLLDPVRDAAADLVMRYARTHGPFTSRELADRLGMGHRSAEGVLRRLVAAGRLVEGDFRPGGIHREWCDANVLATIRRRSLARLRHQVEPVGPEVLARLVTVWQGVTRRRRGLDALLDAVERLQGAPLVASIVETEILPARVDDYAPADLDALLAAGEVAWVGVEPLGDRDGRLALYLTDHLPRLWRPPVVPPDLGERERAILDALESRGALFFAAIHDAAGGGFPGDTVDALWSLAWRGLVTNDSWHALRAVLRPPARTRRARSGGAGAGIGSTPAGAASTPRRTFRSRRTSPPAGEGRWSLVAAGRIAPTPTAWSAALADQLLTRYGVVTREIAPVENLPGGFSAVYDVLKTMEERGRVRRGYFAGGVGALQFASPAALDMLRSLRQDPEVPEVVRLAATDPANPYGTLLKWPAPDSSLEVMGRGPTRSAGAQVVLVNGRLAAFIGRNGKPVFSYLAEHEPDRSVMARAVAGELAAIAQTGEGRHGGLLVAEVNGAPVGSHPLATALAAAGFLPSPLGLHLPRRPAHEPRQRQPAPTATNPSTGTEPAARRAVRAHGGPTSSPFRAMARAPVSTLDDLDAFGDPVHSPATRGPGDDDEAGE